jgi:hypothetical protein
MAGVLQAMQHVQALSAVPALACMSRRLSSSASCANWFNHVEMAPRDPILGKPTKPMMHMLFTAMEFSAVYCKIC